jgi:hypothetical protein
MSVQCQCGVSTIASVVGADKTGSYSTE